MRAPAVCWALAGAIVLTGCAAEESDPESASARTPSASTAAPASPSHDELALDAYRGMWGVVVDGSHEGAVGHPDLESYASGQALELTLAMLQGVVATGEPELAPEVVGMDLGSDPPVVSIEDCIDSSEWLVTTDGQSSQVGERRRLATAEVVLTGQRWLVEDLWLEDYGSC